MKIIWAIDPFESESDALRHLTLLLTDIVQKTGAKIEPVSVVSPDLFHLPVEYVNQGVEKYCSVAERELDIFLENHPIPGLLPPRILAQNQYSVRHNTKTLSDYATRSEADLVAMGTHGRGGVSRFFLGSFTESFLALSTVPVLTVGPRLQQDHAIRHILFATDFEKFSGDIFEEVMSLARYLEAKITVINAVPRIIEPVIQTGVLAFGGGWVDWPEAVPDPTQQARRLRLKQVQQFVDEAKRRGIAAQAEVISAIPNVPEALLLHAEQNHVDMIMLAAQSSSLEATLLGSVTRYVVRKSSCPVWVLKKGAHERRLWSQTPKLQSDQTAIGG